MIDLLAIDGPDVVHLLEPGSVRGGEPLDAGHLGGEGEVSPALTNHKPSFYLLTNHSPCYLDGDPPLLAEAVPLHLDFYQFFCHLGLLLKPEMVG